MSVNTTTAARPVRHTSAVIGASRKLYVRYPAGLQETDEEFKRVVTSLTYYGFRCNRAVMMKDDAGLYLLLTVSCAAEFKESAREFGRGLGLPYVATRRPARSRKLVH